MLSQTFPTYASALDAAGFGSWHEEASDSTPFSSLFVVFHVDEADRKYVLQGFDAREMAAAIDPAGSEFPVSLLQLTFQYPFEVLPSCFSDVARLLHRLNNLMPIGSFLLSEDDQCVCHRTAIPADETTVPPEMLVVTVRIIQQFCVDLAGLIEAAAGGGMSYDQILSELTEGLE